MFERGVCYAVCDIRDSGIEYASNRLEGYFLRYGRLSPFSCGYELVVHSYLCSFL